jgi:formylglycine-generating enzyme required for sulfatase activity
VAPAGSYPTGRSRFGALDMSGNVAEWVADWYGEDYYSSSPAANPQGPATGSQRVLRGGAWSLNYGDYEATWARFSSAPAYRDNTIGFRCAR